MKWFRGLGVVVLTMGILAPAAAAAEFGVRAGTYNDAEDELVGVESAWNTGAITFNPNIEYILTEDDDVTALTGNFDVLYNFGRSTIRPFIGAGLGVLYVDDDFFGDETEGLVNVIGGLKWELDFLKPYVQVKYFRALDSDIEGDDLAFTLGLRF